jgi:hypothetical protein
MNSEADLIMRRESLSDALMFSLISRRSIPIVKELRGVRTWECKGVEVKGVEVEGAGVKVVRCKRGRG